MLAQALEEKYWLAKYVWQEDDFFDGLLNDSGIPMDMRAEIFPRVLEYAECMCSRDQFRYVSEGRLKSAFPEDPLLPLIVTVCGQLSSRCFRNFKRLGAAKGSFVAC